MKKTTKMSKLKSFIASRSRSIVGSSVATPPKPEVGFKITYSERTKQIIVKVIGARNLPTLYGNTRPEGYLVKVRVFPGREKYETQTIKESWPTFNQEFNFDLQTNCTKQEEQFLGKFVVFTVYALMEQQNKNDTPKSKNSFKKFFSITNESQNLKKDDSIRHSANRISLNNRRTVGAVTYNLESKIFTQKSRNDCVSTLDVWREAQNISSGIEQETRESKKGELEVTLTFSKSEDGNNDMFEMCLSRLRCSMKTMQEHEKLNGSLYIKMAAFNDDIRIAKWKSDRFDPTISMKIEPKTAVLRAFVNNSELNYIRLVVRLVNKSVLSKKTVLGKIQIDNRTDIWKNMMETPTAAITQMIRFE